MKKWNICKTDAENIADLKAKSDLSELCCKVLSAQGYKNIEQAASVLNCHELSNPFLICDMRKAADFINQAIEENKKICVYGDYDCDGVMSTVILYSFLSEMGANVVWRIPERSEGYGLNKNAIHEMHADGVELIVTVDNGISATQEARLIQELGMELIITDHHQPGEELPEALAIVDAHRMDNVSPFRLYCGAGIALLLVAAMNDGDLQMAMEQFGDLAAIATIGDIVPLTSENRFLVQRGMEYLENTERVGLIALREVSGLTNKPLNSSSIAFTITPRINAAGRLASPKLAVELLLEENPEKAKLIAQELQQINSNRQECGAEIVKEIEQQILEQPMLLHERVLVFAGKDWNAGIIGIVASKMQERFGKPCFMIAIQDGYGRGSARSFGSFHVFKALTACAELLEKFGGHPSAGGFSLKEENIPAFKKALAEYSKIHHPDMPFMEIQVAGLLQPDMITLQAVESLNQLEPFGEGNPEPIFLAEHVRVQEIQQTMKGLHTKMKIQLQGKSYSAMLFGKTPEQTGIIAGNNYHMLTSLNLNHYNGRTSVTLNIHEVRPVGLQQMKILNAMQVYDKYCREEELPKEYYQAMCPTRQELIIIYQEIAKKPITAEALFPAITDKNINYCKLLIALDIFAELKLIALNPVTNLAALLPVQKKVNLDDSQILSNLKKYCEN